MKCKGCFLLKALVLIFFVVQDASPEVFREGSREIFMGRVQVFYMLFREVLNSLFHEMLHEISHAISHENFHEILAQLLLKTLAFSNKSN